MNLGAFDEVATFEVDARSDQGEEEGCVNRSPANLDRFDKLEDIARAATALPTSLVALVRRHTLAKVDSTGRDATLTKPDGRTAHHPEARARERGFR